MKKSDREIVEILEAFDLTKTPHSAAALAGFDEKTVGRFVTARDVGRDPFAGIERPSLIDPWVAKIEEWVDGFGAKVRADVVHDKFVVMGCTGSSRTTRRPCRRPGRGGGLRYSTRRRHRAHRHNRRPLRIPHIPTTPWDSALSIGSAQCHTVVTKRG